MDSIVPDMFSLFLYRYQASGRAGDAADFVAFSRALLRDYGLMGAAVGDQRMTGRDVSLIFKDGARVLVSVAGDPVGEETRRRAQDILRTSVAEAANEERRGGLVSTPASPRLPYVPGTQDQIHAPQPENWGALSSVMPPVVSAFGPSIIPSLFDNLPTADGSLRPPEAHNIMGPPPPAMPPGPPGYTPLF